MLTTPAVRISYPNVFEAHAISGGKPKYSVVMMFNKQDPEHMAALKRLKAEAQAVLEQKWPDEKKRPRIPISGHDRSPIKDGDKACDQQGIPLVEKNEEYAGHYLVRASTDKRPVAVAKDKSELLEDPFYGGCWAKVNVNAYAYQKDANQGVTFGLNGIMFWADDEAFGGGRPSMDAMFGGESDGSEDAANYDDPLA